MDFLIDWLLCSGSFAVFTFVPAGTAGRDALRIALAGLLLAIAMMTTVRF